MEEKRPAEYFDFGMYTWNIDRARELIKNRRRNKRPKTVDVDEIYNAIRWGGFLGIQIDEEYALTKADVTKPLIFGLIKIPKKRGSDEPHGWFRILIDGHHRLYRAKHEGISTLPAYDLSKPENHKTAEGIHRPPPRRNPDEELRRYERSAFEGDVASKVRLLQRYLRSGKITEQQIDLAAFYGDLAAQLISTNWFGEVSPEGLRTYITSLITQKIPLDTEFLARRAWCALDHAYQKAEQRTADSRWQSVLRAWPGRLLIEVEEIFEQLRMYLDMLKGYLDEYNVETLQQEAPDVIKTVQTMVAELEAAEPPGSEAIYLSPPVNLLIRATLSYLRDFVVAARGYAIDSTFQDPYWYALRSISLRQGPAIVPPEIEVEAFMFVAPRIIPWLLSPKN